MRVISVILVGSVDEMVKECILLVVLVLLVVNESG